MFEPPETAGEFQTEDRVPETLTPALRSIFDEMVPFLAECARELAKTPVFPEQQPQGDPVSRRDPLPVGRRLVSQTGFSYPVWMAQRLQDAFRQMPEVDQGAVRRWLDTVGGGDVLQLDLPRVTRVGLAAARIA